jgi:hypothetical protein
MSQRWYIPPPVVSKPLVKATAVIKHFVVVNTHIASWYEEGSLIAPQWENQAYWVQVAQFQRLTWV